MSPLNLMGLINNIRNLLVRSKSSDNSGGKTSSAPRRGGVLEPLSGTALNVATVYRCVNLLADSVASLPMQYMRKRGEIFVGDEGDRLHYLLNVQPAPHMSAVDFWQKVVQYILLRGNAYIVPIYDPFSLEIDRLCLVNPDCVAHDIRNDTYNVVDTLAGVSGVYTEQEIIHIKNYSVDGKTGVSTLTYALMATTTAQTGDREAKHRFENGGNVRGLVSNDTSVRGFGEYQDQELERTAVDIDERFRSGERIVSLPGQVQFTPLSLSSTDMQFLQMRVFLVREICRFFGVHPSFVFDDTSNNYKSAEMANVAFLVNTLNPLLRKIETELLRKLVAPSLCHKRKFLFDRESLYACDLDSRIKYQTQTIAAGIYTVNEWRRKENKPAVEGGDKVLVSANLKGIDELHASTPQSSKDEPTKNNKDDDKE